MSLQDTVLELFEAGHIDKASAYRLLAAARSSGDVAASLAHSQWHRVLEQSLRLHGEPAWRLMLAGLSSVAPALRAARTPVVEALRHA